MKQFLLANIKLALFAAFALLIVLYHFIGFQTHYGTDDLMYARMANDLMNGNLLLDDHHFAYRWSILGLTALSYQLFGITDLASALPAMVISIITLYLVYAATRQLNTLGTFMALSLFTLTPWMLFHTDKLMPDIYMSLGSLASIVVVNQYRNGKIRKPWIAGLLFSVSIFFAVLSKAAIVLLVPVILFILVSDLLQKKNVRFWVLSTSILALMLIAYLGILYWLTGSALSRVTAAATSNFFNLSTYAQRPASELIGRITYGLPMLFTEHIFMTALMFSILPLLTLGLRDVFRMSDPKMFFSTITIVACLSANFMSTSFDHYIPMLAQPRHFLFLIPLAAIATAPVLYAYFANREFKNRVLLMSAIIALASLFTGNALAMWTYCGVLGVVAVRYFLPPDNKQLVVVSFFLSFACLLLVKPIDDVLVGIRSNYKSQKHLIKSHLIGASDHAVVITNTVQKTFAEYYQEFQTADNPRWITYAEEPRYSFQPDDEIYVLNNSSTQALSALSYFDAPLYSRRIPKSAEPIHAEQGLVLYRVQNREALIREESIMTESNDFETPNSHWSDYSGSVTSQYSLSGAVSCEVPAHGFSASYTLPFSELTTISANVVHLVCSIHIRTEQVGAVEVVLIAEEDGETKLWHSGGGDSFEPSGGNWWRAVKHQEYDLELLSNATLRVYVWNRGGDNIFIDDFKIEVLQ